MIANAAIQFPTYEHHIFKEWRLSESDNMVDGSCISFMEYNCECELFNQASTEDIIKNEYAISRRILDIQKVDAFYDAHPEIFALSSKQDVISTFDNVRDCILQLSPDLYSISLSIEEECLFIYCQKDNVKLFFNLFFDDDKIEPLINVSTPNDKYSIEDDIEQSTKKLQEILQQYI